MDPVVEVSPRFVEPMLLEHGPPAAPAAGEWAIEVKYDAIRAQLRLDDGGQWSMRSRPGRDCSAQFPELGDGRDPRAAARDLRWRARASRG
jgi:bifunctional non-homologous end joining protein LigD